LISGIPLSYRAIGNQYYKVQMQPSIGALKFIVTNSSAAIDKPEAIRDSLNKDQMKFSFSSIF
jgi:hypothetical protein